MLHSLTLFFTILVAPIVTVVLMHCFLTLNFESKRESAYSTSILTLLLFLVSCIGCVITYGVETWDLLAVFGAAGLLFFTAFTRASLVLVVVSPASVADGAESVLANELTTPI